MFATLQSWTICLLLLAGAADDSDFWPQFRGPNGQGHSTATGLPIRWAEDHNVTWKVAISGSGWSSPVVLGDQVWLTTALAGGKSLRAVCIDRESGATVHDIEVFSPANPVLVNGKNSHASPTPSIEPGRVYVNFGTMGTACLDTESGQILWVSHELVLDHKEGPGSSPVLHGEILLINCDGIDAQYVAALDKQTGHLLWKTPRSGKLNDNPDFRKAYSTPLVIDVDGVAQAISPGADHVVAYEPRSGAELWSVDYEGFSNVPRPVYGNGLVFVCTGYMQPQLWAIQPSSDSQSQPKVAWRYTSQVPANPSPILVGDDLYLVSDQGVLTCIESQSGRERWKKRLGGNYSASPVFADGRLYFFSEDGAATVVRPGRKFELLATNRLDGRMQASPAVAGGSIFVRTDHHLYRLDEVTLAGDASPAQR